MPSSGSDNAVVDDDYHYESVKIENDNYQRRRLSRYFSDDVFELVETTTEKSNIDFNEIEGNNNSNNNNDNDNNTQDNVRIKIKVREKVEATMNEQKKKKGNQRTVHFQNKQMDDGKNGNHNLSDSRFLPMLPKLFEKLKTRLTKPHGYKEEAAATSQDSILSSDFMPIKYYKMSLFSDSGLKGGLVRKQIKIAPLVSGKSRYIDWKLQSDGTYENKINTFQIPKFNFNNSKPIPMITTREATKTQPNLIGCENDDCDD